jgi:type IV pilus assembly protein PilF
MLNTAWCSPVEVFARVLRAPVRTSMQPLKSPSQTAQKPFFMLFGLLAGVLLSSCASNSVATPEAAAAPARPSTDLVTASDEPESRRRARIRLELAANYLDSGQATTALDEIKQSLAIDPNYAEAFNLRGAVYMRMNEIALAEDSFRRAQALNPRDPDTAHNYGVMLCQQRRFNEAVSQFQAALSNPTYRNQARSYAAMGLCQERAGDRATAESTLARAFELDASNPVVGYNLSRLLYARGDFVKAQFHLKRINAGEFANQETLWLAARTERRLGNDAATREMGNQLVQKFPQSPQAQQFQRGQFD